MVEPALYSNVCEGARIHGRPHGVVARPLLAWGETKSAIITRIESLNKKGIFAPIADVLAAAHKNGFPRANWASKVCYILKATQESLPAFKWEEVTTRW